MIPTLQEMREKRKLSREHIAAEIGVSVTTIKNWETGDVDPAEMSYSKAVKLAGFYSVSLEFIGKVFSVTCPYTE